MNPHKLFLKATFWVVFFVLSHSDILYANVPSSEEIKSFWVVRYSMVSQEEIDHALHTASELGFNHVFLQVRGRGDAYYSSQIVPRGRFLTDPDFDPLSYAVEKGHSLGLKVHAWLNIFLLWSSPELPKIQLIFFSFTLIGLMRRETVSRILSPTSITEAEGLLALFLLQQKV